jgi:hypothetical protein
MERGMTKMSLTASAVVASAVIASMTVLAGAANAQNSLPPAQAVPAAPSQQPCTSEINPAARATPPMQGEKGLGQARANETRGQGGPSQSASLSDKLSEGNGVICPPRTGDREMAAPPPGGGRMPVIPPPGTPGGDQSVQPK